MRVVWPPHCDYLRCVQPGAPEDCGFVPYQNRWWRPGWWAKLDADRQGKPRTTADAEAAARVWPQAWAAAAHLTRVDVCCDVVGVHFDADARLLFTGRGRRTLEEEKHEARGLRIGGRESPIFLRIYCKSKSAKVTERDREHWRANGWNGQDDVWRIEYEFHTKALPRDLAVPRDVMALWNDGLARIRMCAVPPRQYSQQNKCPTHKWWLALGNPARLSRRGGRPPAPLPDATAASLLAQLDRLAVRAGAGMLPRLLERLHRYQDVAKGKHGEKGTKE